jgi:hypothetical protein
LATTGKLPTHKERAASMRCMQLGDQNPIHQNRRFVHALSRAGLGVRTGVQTQSPIWPVGRTITLTIVTSLSKPKGLDFWKSNVCNASLQPKSQSDTCGNAGQSNPKTRLIDIASILTKGLPSNASVRDGGLIPKKWYSQKLRDFNCC